MLILSLLPSHLCWAIDLLGAELAVSRAAPAPPFTRGCWFAVPRWGARRECRPRSRSAGTEQQCCDVSDAASASTRRRGRGPGHDDGRVLAVWAYACYAVPVDAASSSACVSPDRGRRLRRRVVTALRGPIRLQSQRGMPLGYRTLCREVQHRHRLPERRGLQLVRDEFLPDVPGLHRCLHPPALTARHPASGERVASSRSGRRG
jgi:hypothetical protein